jgi:hypothetical protein
MEDDRRCPRCDADKVVPIRYGMSTEEAVEAAVWGEVALGGCMARPDAPNTHCRSCGHEWRADEALSLD